MLNLKKTSKDFFRGAGTGCTMGSAGGLFLGTFVFPGLGSALGCSLGALTGSLLGGASVVLISRGGTNEVALLDIDLLEISQSDNLLANGFFSTNSRQENTIENVSQDLENLATEGFLEREMI